MDRRITDYMDGLSPFPALLVRIGKLVFEKRTHIFLAFGTYHGFAKLYPEASGWIALFIGFFCVMGLILVLLAAVGLTGDIISAIREYRANERIEQCKPTTPSL